MKQVKKLVNAKAVPAGRKVFLKNPVPMAIMALGVLLLCCGLTMLPFQ